MNRQHCAPGPPYEPILGISRAVRIGNTIAIAGTAPLGPEGKTVAPGDAAGQMRRCIEIARRALEQLDASLSDVIRTRTLLTHIEDWEAVGRVHGEVFKDIRPVNTVMQVTRFIDPDWLVGIEVDAVVQAKSVEGIDQETFIQHGNGGEASHAFTSEAGACLPQFGDHLPAAGL